MTYSDRLWLGGWIALCLGIADDNLALKLIGVALFVIQLWRER